MSPTKANRTETALLLSKAKHGRLSSKEEERLRDLISKEIPSMKDEPLESIVEAGLLGFGIESIKMRRMLDVKNDLKKLDNKKNILILISLSDEGPMGFQELKEKTGMSHLLLHETLLDLKDANFIQLDEKKYYLTDYGSTLISTVLSTNQALQALN